MEVNEMIPKPKTYRSSKYLAYIRKQPCIVCEKAPSQAHHIYTGGMGIKCSDLQTVPLCPEHHQEVDGINSGKETFSEEYGIDWRTERLRLLVGYIDQKDEIEDVRDILLKTLETFIERED